MSLIGLIMSFLCLQVSYEHREEIDAKQEEFGNMTKIQTARRFCLRTSGRPETELGAQTLLSGVRTLGPDEVHLQRAFDEIFLPKAYKCGSKLVLEDIHILGED